ncbi:unnamed protein product, partial [Mesorhabditis belari]|uniref:Small acidic protein-like domain-containing protein n=1 Tax=Mesorhabditis belari TaxID=2138241 RepID=A0AAF3J5D6_9BILA
MVQHKKFASSSDEEDEKKKKKSEKSDLIRQTEHDRAKRQERKDRNERDESREDRRKQRKVDEEERERTDRGNKAKKKRHDEDKLRQEKGKIRREREERESSDAPAWSTNRVKEHAAKIKERKLLWQGKRESDVNETDQPSTSFTDQQAVKNIGMWSSAIAATGVDDKQAEKFKKLLGFKGAQKDVKESTASNVNAERAKQQNLLSSLDQQFSTARQMTRNSRGSGLGYH